MAVYRWGFSDPWREMRELQREMNSILDSAYGRTEETMPACNVWAGDDDLMVTCEMPGVSMDDLHIAVMGDTLQLQGQRKPQEDVERAAYHRRERRVGTFSRTVQLPARVDPEKVEADYRDGVLYVTLPKAAAEKPRRIEIKVA